MLRTLRSCCIDRQRINDYSAPLNWTPLGVTAVWDGVFVFGICIGSHLNAVFGCVRIPIIIDKKQRIFIHIRIQDQKIFVFSE